MPMRARPPKKTKAKAKAKAAPKKSVPKDTRPQRERFEEAAAKAGGIDADAFERAMGQIATPKKPKT